MISVDAKIEGVDRTEAQFAQARREIYRKTRTGMKRAGERTILPAARRGTSAHTPVASTQVVVKTTGSYAYLTVATKKAGRIVGYLNFGGRLDPVKPRKGRRGQGGHAPAVSFGGVVVAQTLRKRRHRGSHFLEEARDRHLDEFGERMLVDLMAAFDPLDHTP